MTPRPRPKANAATLYRSGGSDEFAEVDSGMRAGEKPPQPKLVLLH
jgi:hypothetical protein